MSPHSATTLQARQPSRGLLRRTAAALAQSPFLRRGRELWAKNEKDWNLPMSKWDKLHAGAYLILRDYATGAFPPVFRDQQQAYQNEINYRQALPGLSEAEITRADLTKPFWFGSALQMYVGDFLKLARALETARVAPPARVLELGGGSGWTAEFLANLGFDVVSTTLSPAEVETASRRLDALRARGVPFKLRFIVSPMETVADKVKEFCPFDAAFVYEALHHAFDWKAAVRSAFSCLRDGGWLLLCNEPNVLHTAVSYRVATLAHTHEIGFSKRELLAHLRQTGFQRVISLGKQPHLFCRKHWLLAQK